jgi:hypothetical protein
VPEWGPALERLVKERGIVTSIDARDDHSLLDLASDLQEDLRTIRVSAILTSPIMVRQPRSDARSRRPPFCTPNLGALG